MIILEKTINTTEQKSRKKSLLENTGLRKSTENQTKELSCLHLSPNTKYLLGERTNDLRQKYLNYLKFDLNCSNFTFKDFKVFFQDKSGNKCIYQPFIKINYRKDISPVKFWKPKIVDVWSYRDIAKNKDWFFRAYRAGKKLAKQKDFEFLLVTDIFFETDYFKNAEFLVSKSEFILDDRFNERTKRLENGLKELGKIQIRYLLEYISEDDDAKGENEKVLWRLLKNRIVNTNYFQLITESSMVWLQK